MLANVTVQRQQLESGKLDAEQAVVPACRSVRFVRGSATIVERVFLGIGCERAVASATQALHAEGSCSCSIETRYVSALPGAFDDCRLWRFPARRKVHTPLMSEETTFASALTAAALQLQLQALQPSTVGLKINWTTEDTLRYAERQCNACHTSSPPTALRSGPS